MTDFGDWIALVTVVAIARQVPRIVVILVVAVLAVYVLRLRREPSDLKYVAKLLAAEGGKKQRMRRGLINGWPTRGNPAP